jgi:hypothetical protein
LEVVRSNKTVEEIATVSGLSGRIDMAIVLYAVATYAIEASVHFG